VTNRLRHQQLVEAFTTDANIIRLINRRVTIYPTAVARQIFDSDSDAANFKKISGVIPPDFDLVGSSIKGRKAFSLIK